MSISGSFSFKSNFTKSGVAKRVFKPTIPSTRNVSQTSACSQSLESNGHNECNKSQFSSCVKKKIKSKKKLIQIDPTFNGTDTKFSMMPRIKQEKLNNLNCNEPNTNKDKIIKVKQEPCEEVTFFEDNLIKTECKTGKEKENLVKTVFDDNFEKFLYRDDFIKHAEDAGPNLPLGWENLVQLRNDKKQINSCIKKEKKDEESLIILQLPEIILNKNNGHIGKLKIYKSGKIELIDDETKLNYEIKATHNESFLDSLLSIAKSKEKLNLNQEVVTFENNEITCLGSVNANQILIGYTPIDHILKQELSCN